MASITNNLIEQIQIDDNDVSSIASTAYGVCDTAAGTAAKVVEMTGFKLITGVTIHVKFTYANSAANPTLAVKYGSGENDVTAAKAIKQYGTTAVADTASTTGWQANAVVSLTYDGTYWIRDQGYNTNTTYSVITAAAAWTGTATTGRTISASVLKSILANLGGSGLTLTHDATNGIILDHTNSVTEKTSYASTATTANANGGTIKLTDIKYDAQGHITDSTDRTITLSVPVTSVNGNTGDVTITDSDEKVKQQPSTSNLALPLLFRNNTDSTSSTTEGVRFVTSVKVQPSTGNLTATTFNNYTLGAACAKGVITTFTNNTTSANLPTAAAVASYVSGLGYTTNDGTVTDITIKTSSPLSGGSNTSATSSGTWTIGFANQEANTILAGPSSGNAGAPTFRTLALADISDALGVDSTHGNNFLRKDGTWQPITAGVSSIGTLSGAIGTSDLLAELGLSSAMHFKGRVNALPNDSTSFSTYESGDVILGPDNKEYVYNKGEDVSHSAWIELGKEGSWSTSDHTHGNITNAGGIGQSANWELASGDGLIIFDSSNSNKLERTGIIFDASTTNQALSKKGTWENIDKVKTTSSNEDIEYKILGCAGGASITSGNNYEAIYSSTSITFNPGDGSITASEFIGSLTGNANTATAASSDAWGDANGIAYYSDSTGTFASTSAGDNGWILVGRGGNAAPEWQEILPVAHGGTGAAGFTDDCIIVPKTTNSTQIFESRALKVTQSTSNNLTHITLTNNVTNGNVNIEASGSGAINIDSTTGALSINSTTGVLTVQSDYGSLILQGGNANTNTQSALTLGNGTIKTQNNQSEGIIVLYSTGTKTHTIISDPTVDNTHDHTHYLSNADGYIVQAPSNSAVGGDKQLVYVAANGVATVSNATEGTSSKPVYLSNGTITAISDSVGDPYTPIYSDAGVLTAVSPVQYIDWTIDSGKLGVTLTSAALKNNTYVISLVVTSGAEYLNTPLRWSSSNNNGNTTGNVTISTTTQVSGNVTGYIIIARGTDITSETTFTQITS